MFKKGDTLIEVTIAIGIFSLIAITIATVMSSGTAGSQNALETLITRQEIDAQADALRFIHESYITNKDPESNPYADIWNKIISKAQSANNAPVQFAPTTCQELYDSNNGQVFKNGGFIINTRDLSSASSIIEASSNSTPNTSQFTTTSTYPRLLFAGSNDMLENLTNKNLSRAEGIYIIGVKGNDANIVAGDGAISYYDFYIRSCWYDANSETPTTISTLIRLSDAPATESAGPSKISILTVDYYNNYVKAGDFYKPKNPIAQSTKIELNQPGPLRNLRDEGWGYYRFNGWCSVEPDPTNNQCDGDFYEVNSSDFSITNTNGGRKSLYAIWNKDPFTVTYDAGEEAVISNENGDRIHIIKDGVPAFDDREKNYEIPNISKPKQSGWSFKGWCESTAPIPKGDSCPSNKLYKPGDTYGPLTKSTTFYAIWDQYDLVITAKLSWGQSPRDLDSHVEGQKADGSDFHAYYHEKTYSEGITIAQLDQDITSGYGPETMTIHTLGGRNYYYYVKNFSSDTKIPNATVAVTVYDPYSNTTTNYSFNSNNSVGNGRYWNVFAYKDGEIVTPLSNGGTTSTNAPNKTY